jgi:chromate transporter
MILPYEIENGRRAVSAGARFLEIFGIFLRLGLTSFGGPVAHLGYFRAEFVSRRAWLSESDYADMVALCQFLPGPTSSQVGLALGLRRGGLAGAAAAWIGFTLPSALAMMAFASSVAWLGNIEHQPWLHGLKVVAVAVVAQAVWSMAKSLCPDRARASLAVLAGILALIMPTWLGQIGAILLGGLVGLRLKTSATPTPTSNETPPRPVWGVVAILLFFALLIGLPALAAWSNNREIALLAGFFRSGALVFGGGHVVLPLLQEATVPSGWVSSDAFLAGYGAAQAVPGPLFTFAAYLGTMEGGWSHGLLCLLAIYLPSFLLMAGTVPFWSALRRKAKIQAALSGINAAVVGLLMAALYHPVWTSAIFSPADISLAAGLFVLLQFWKCPPWAVVAMGAAIAHFAAQ